MPKYLQAVTNAINQGEPVMAFFLLFAIIWVAEISQCSFKGRFQALALFGE